MTVPKSHIRTVLSTAETERTNAIAGLPAKSGELNLELSILDKVITLLKSDL